MLHLANLIFLALFLNASISRGSYVTDTVKPLPHNLARYHHFTNQAARSIYANDFEAASIAYDSAFHYRKQPYYVDLKNYILVNHKTGQYTKNTIALMHMLTNKQIDSTRLFTEIPKRVLSAENIALTRKLSTTQSKMKLADTPLQKALRDMWASDQGVRNYTLDKKNKKGWEQMYLARDSTDEANFLRLEKLVGQLGFPTEEKVGVFFDTATTWSHVIHVLLLHFRSGNQPLIRNRALSLINTALLNGFLHPAIAAALLDYQVKEDSSSYLFLSTTVELVFDQPYRPMVLYSDSLMRAVNADRIAIGLDSFHITQRQVVCQFFGSQSLSDTTRITMVPYASIDELPPGLVNQAAKAAGVELADYRMNTTAILEECNCEKKMY